MSLIPAPISSAIADRAKILGTLETLVIGAAGGLLFLGLNLPGGLISGAMAAVGIAALAGRPVTMAKVALDAFCTRSSASLARVHCHIATPTRINASVIPPVNAAMVRR